MDLSPFLKPFSEGDPSGVELRYVTGFDEIAHLVLPASRAARTNDAGVCRTTSQVDWTALLQKAEVLAEKGRDLRLLVMVVRAKANLDSFAGLAEGLTMLRAAIADYWPSIHPMLRDRNTAAEAIQPRKGALMALEDTDAGALGDLRMNALFDRRALGEVTGDDLSYAMVTEFDLVKDGPTGMSDSERALFVEKHEARASRVMAAVRGLADEEPERLKAMLDGIIAADTARAALEHSFAEAAGLTNGAGLRLGALEKFLTRCRATLEAAMTLDVSAQDAAPAANAAPQASVAPQAAPSAGHPGTIGSRADVMTCLDGIIAFYENTEPSSPIPHLARRMRKMVPMNFLELMDELAPSGKKEFEKVAGFEEKTK